MGFVFQPAAQPYVPVRGTDKDFPVRRIFCVGRNYAEHTKEMGGDPKSDPPVFFTKPADAILPNRVRLEYPLATENLHHEVELVVALGYGGAELSVEEAPKTIFGYAVGNDFTRRDLQLAAKDRGCPWDTAKAFDRSAAIGAITPIADSTISDDSQIGLKVNGNFRQQAKLGDMIWTVPEIISELSRYFELQPGDLIYTGTPEGVGPVEPGDTVEASIEGLGVLTNSIAGRR